MKAHIKESIRYQQSVETDQIDVRSELIPNPWNLVAVHMLIPEISHYQNQEGIFQQPVTNRINN